MSDEQNIPEDVNREPAKSNMPTKYEELSTVNQQQSTEMEVHHHPEVEKKGFKEYLLEGLMIFVAVTLGFFAESIREHITDNTKEKEYIRSMIEDAATDTANIHLAIVQNNIRILHLDSLANICINYNEVLNIDADIYRHYKYGLIHPTFISPTERTMQQLKNAGGMRLVRKKAAVDSIILYDDMAKKLADQQAYYELYQNKSLDIAIQIFNFQKFRFGISASNSKTAADNKESFKLLINDKTKLTAFGNCILVFEGVVNFYTVLLNEMRNHAVYLIQTLQKEYNLTNE